VLLSWVPVKSIDDLHHVVDVLLDCTEEITITAEKPAYYSIPSGRIRGNAEQTAAGRPTRNARKKG
jgi:hypothetical protein